jgi:hypothetical protein
MSLNEYATISTIYLSLLDMLKRPFHKTYPSFEQTFLSTYYPILKKTYEFRRIKTLINKQLQSTL